MVKGNVVIGDSVKIKGKNGDETSGMVRSILRDSGGKMIVELFNGSMGEVVLKLPKRAITPIKKRSLIAKYEKEDLKNLFSGERVDLEYKLSALWSQNLSRDELEKLKSPEVKKYGNRASKIIIAKVIAGFMNSSGGDLIIGIKEDKKNDGKYEIVGVDEEFKLLKNKDHSEDGYRRMIMDDIIRVYFPNSIYNHFNNYFSISFFKEKGKTLCKINVRKSEEEIFISIANEDLFFVRVDTQTRELKGKEVVDYIRKRF